MMTDRETIRREFEQINTAISSVTDYCYEQKEQAAYNEMTKLTDMLMHATELLFAYKQENAEFIFKQDELISVLGEMMKAMEEKDLVLLADMLEYELKGIIEEILDGVL